MEQRSASLAFDDVTLRTGRSVQKLALAANLRTTRGTVVASLAVAAATPAAVAPPGVRQVRVGEGQG